MLNRCTRQEAEVLGLGDSGLVTGHAEHAGALHGIQADTNMGNIWTDSNIEKNMNWLANRDVGKKKMQK